MPWREGALCCLFHLLLLFALYISVAELYFNRKSIDQELLITVVQNDKMRGHIIFAVENIHHPCCCTWYAPFDGQDGGLLTLHSAVHLPWFSISLLFLLIPWLIRAYRCIHYRLVLHEQMCALRQIRRPLISQSSVIYVL